MPARNDPAGLMTVRVQRVLPFGLLVDCNNRVGIIREREIAWTSDARRHWRERFKPGDTLQAALLGEDASQRLELSLRLAQSDPWVDLEKRYTLGQIVTGVVTGVQPYGVFVEIEPGVTGLLHQTRLPSWATNVEDWFWPGDDVQAAIELLDPTHRRIGLNLMYAWSQRWRRVDADENAQTGQPDQPAAAFDFTPPPDSAGEYASRAALETLIQRRTPWFILIVEDDEAQQQALAGWLRSIGQRTLTASSAEESLTLLENERPDLVLMDLGLPGTDGFQALQSIRQRWPTLRLVLMTDWARASDRLPNLEMLDLAGIELLLKPLLPDDVLGILHNPTDQTVKKSDAPLTGDSTLTTEEILAARRGEAALGSLLRRLRGSVGAAKVVLFAFDAVQRKVWIATESGKQPLNPAALADLVYSPVRDVAEDRCQIHITDAEHSAAHVRYLKPLLEFRACLGAPVQVQSPQSYALFLFHDQPRTFSDSYKQYALAAALEAGALLERQRFQEQAVDAQRLALLGQLSRALVHEMNHQLSPINFALEDLREQCGQSEEAAANDPETVIQTMHKAQLALANLTEGVRRLTETARLFGRVTVQSQEQRVILDTAIKESVYLVRDMADRQHVTIVTHPSTESITLRIHAARIQQILLNVMINAIQQIGLIRPGVGGRIHIRTEPTRRESTPVVQIRIEDDGPGVHRRLWERIFELGFTTRDEGGSGLGLYISRGLVEALGGRIFIMQSYALWGTTFVIELPIATEPGGSYDPRAHC